MHFAFCILKEATFYAQENLILAIPVISPQKLAVCAFLFISTNQTCGRLDTTSINVLTMGVTSAPV